MSVPHPVLYGLPFENETVATETLRKSPRLKKLPESHRRDERSRNLPCPRKSRTEIQRLSPEHWTLSNGSWGVCDRWQIQRDQPARRCGGGRPWWGTHHTDTGTAWTAGLAWPTPPRRPGRTMQREGHSWRGPSGASAPPLESWSGSQSWVEKQEKKEIKTSCY